MEDIVNEPVILNTIGRDPIIIKAVVNGLIATSIIWVFWTPFLIFVASPLINAMIKDFVCHMSGRIPGLIYSEGGPQAYEIYEQNIPNPPTVATKIINQNSNTFISENLVLFIIFGITSVFVIYGSLYFANHLIYKYNINLYEIIYFNIVMGIIIVITEILFFILVTTKYKAFNSKTIVQQISKKINDTFIALI
jgi:hypothetical protein